MNNASIVNSDRLRRVLRLLSDGQEHSTLDVVQRANVCAVSACMSELRANGISVATRRVKNVWFYRLGKPS